MLTQANNGEVDGVTLAPTKCSETTTSGRSVVNGGSVRGVVRTWIQSDGDDGDDSGEDGYGDNDK